MADKPILTRDVVSQLISYNPETGAIMWLPRPSSMFKTERDRAAWNTRFAGHLAGHLSSHHGVMLSMRQLGAKVSAHRLAFLMMTGVLPTQPVDHINGNPADNRWCNLRLCTAAENNRNRRKQETYMGQPTSSKFRGVYFYKPTKKFVVHIRIPNPDKRGRGKQIHVGYYRTEIEAAKAYDDVARKHHGQFARLNFP